MPTAVKKKPIYNIQMISFVKRVRKALDEKTLAIFDAENTINKTENGSETGGLYKYTNGKKCIIGSALPDTVISQLKKRGKNSEGLAALLVGNILSAPKEYHDRLVKLQFAHDSADLTLTRSRFRHLETAVRKKYPNSFK